MKTIKTQNAARPIVFSNASITIPNVIFLFCIVFSSFKMLRGMVFIYRTMPRGVKQVKDKF